MAFRIQDDLKRELFLVRPPRRVVSLVPSDTYTVAALGAADRLVGRTAYCVEPVGAVEHIPVVGGTKDIDIEAVARLEPDLVLANKEENARAPLEALARSGHQLFISFPRRLAESVTHVARLARILGVDERARDLVRRGLALAGDPPPAPLRAFLPIWMDPLMTLSADTVGSDMLVQAGAANVFAERRRLHPLAADLGKALPRVDDGADRDTRYPRITLDEVVARAPEAILLPDEPHAFTDADAAVFAGLDVPAARRGAIRRVAGKDLFWYGARTIEALPGLRALVAELAARRS